MPLADVAIVGAGPGGAWTACLLARRGCRVRIFDPSHPREKPCGGGVTTRALALVSGSVDLDRLPAVQIRAARFSSVEQDASVSVDLGRDGSHGALGSLIVASRREFDGLLLAAACHAGAELVRARVNDIKREDRGFVIRTADGDSHRAAFLVGADGAASLVRRRLATAFRRDQLSIATGFFAHGVSSHEIVIELMADPPGYIWSFPRPDHLAIGICAPTDAGFTAGALRAKTMAWIHATGIIRNAPTPSLTPYSWPIPSLAARDLDAVEVGGPNWLLVGDAAGLVDPITREGIFFALQSGQFAAEAILSDRGQAGAAYRDRVRTEIGADLARGARFKAGFFRPRVTRLLMHAPVAPRF